MTRNANQNDALGPEVWDLPPSLRRLSAHFGHLRVGDGLRSVSGLRKMAGTRRYLRGENGTTISPQKDWWMHQNSNFVPARCLQQTQILGLADLYSSFRKPCETRLLRRYIW